MKKLVLMLAVVFSVSLFSCGNKEQAAEAEATQEVTEEVSPVVEEVAVVEDSLNAAGDSVVETVAEVATVAQ